MFLLYVRARTVVLAVALLAVPIQSRAEKTLPGAAPLIDPTMVTVPELAFSETPETTQTYDKYFYFHRDGTTFETAYADVRECDGFARGLTSGTTHNSVYSPSAGALGNAVGGAIGTAVADAVFGSAQRRVQRRTNMRVCMGYKGYQRYGLPRDIWKQFNFEEGNSAPTENARQLFLQQQAKIAVGPHPAKPELN